MTIADVKGEKLLHGWIYGIICSISYDREYVYRAFAKHFNEIMKGIFEGFCKEEGIYIINGIKSDYNAHLSWSMPRRLDYIGLNSILLKCVIVNKYTGEELEKHEKAFELSYGESIV